MKSIFKDKSKLNLSIDIVMLLLILPIAGIGFLIKYVLVSGDQRNIVYGSDVDLQFLGMTRHQWGTIHLFISITFLVLLAIHIIVHWKMIVSIFRRMMPDRTLRIVSVVLLTIFCLFMFSFPLLVKPEIVRKEALHRNRINNLYSQSSELEKNDEKNDTAIFKIQKQEMQSNEKNHNNHVNEDKYEVYGSETLQFIADKYNIPVSKIAADLKIPESMTGEKLGRLKKHYSFTMNDVRNSISRNIK